MSGLEIAGIAVISALLGFQGGSIVEYKKKVNLADLERKGFSDVQDLTRDLLYHIRETLHLGATNVAKTTS